jgi:beta-phosphoglucomutase-like phosphatase (HAD superfamily)
VSAYLDRHHVSGRIDVVACRAGHDPGPALVGRAAAALGVAPSACAVVDSRPGDIQAARAAGARGIGYAISPAGIEYLAAARADAILISLADLALGLRHARCRTGRHRCR